MNNFQMIMIFIIFSLSIIDLTLTYIYVKEYKEWQPEKPYKLIEMNPLLRFLWENTNLLIGTLIGAVLILTLDYIIIRTAHWIFPILLLGLLIFAITNHYNNFGLLTKLISQYPSGHLPEEVFGKVIGNK